MKRFLLVGMLCAVSFALIVEAIADTRTHSWSYNGGRGRASARVSGDRAHAGAQTYAPSGGYSWAWGHARSPSGASALATSRSGQVPFHAIPSAGPVPTKPNYTSYGGKPASYGASQARRRYRRAQSQWQSTANQIYWQYGATPSEQRAVNGTRRVR